ncbi:obg gtpase family [Holotrichia oblita]|nr:obg gtpase family [Holotrichia oblita]
MKPVIYIANVSEDDVVAPENNKYFTSVKNFAVGEGNDAIAISIKMEEEISRLEDNEKKEFIKDLGIEAPGLNRLINITYKTLGLRTFFTAGEMESRAWTFTDGSLAPACAGVIHTDFEKGFIRAEVYSYNDLVKYGSEAAVKENGKWRLEGKEYRFQDGDIAHFRFNVR